MNPFLLRTIEVQTGPFKFDPEADCDGVGANNNGDRAARAQGTLETYRELIENHDPLNEEHVSDCICDLLHFCDREEIDIGEALSNAVGRHQEERCSKVQDECTLCGGAYQSLNICPNGQELCADCFARGGGQ